MTQALAPRSTFAGYDVVRRLGSGGMGDVYLVQNPALNRLEALKLTPLASGGEAARRFANEASTMAAFDHPSIVTVYSFGIEGNFAWYTMRYLPGVDLDSVTALPWADVITVVLQIGGALDYAHAHSVVHRDVKPANIHLRFRDDCTVAKATLLDFGVAKMGGRTTHTEVNSFVGTLCYSSPEAISGDTSSPLVDQYSLACTAFEALSGHRPYPVEMLTALIAAHANAPVPHISLHDPRLRPADPVFTRALAKDPADRYPTCGDFARALAAALAPGRAERATDDRHIAHLVRPGSGPRPAPAPAMHSRRPEPSGPTPLPHSTRAKAPSPARRPDVFRRRRSIALLVLIILVSMAAVGVWQIKSANEHSPAGSTSSSGDAEDAADPGPSAGVASERDPSATTGDRAPDEGSGAQHTGEAAGAGGDGNDTWGLAVGPDGKTYAFRDFADHRAIVAYATETWGYSPRTWSLVYFTSGCAAFAAPEFPSPETNGFEYGLGPDRPAASAAAIAKSETSSGLRSRVTDTLCVGDLIP